MTNKCGIMVSVTRTNPANVQLAFVNNVLKFAEARFYKEKIENLLIFSVFNKKNTIRKYTLFLKVKKIIFEDIEFIRK